MKICVLLAVTDSLFVFIFGIVLAFGQIAITLAIAAAVAYCNLVARLLFMRWPRRMAATPLSLF